MIADELMHISDDGGVFGGVLTIEQEIADGGCVVWEIVPVSVAGARYCPEGVSYTVTSNELRSICGACKKKVNAITGDKGYHVVNTVRNNSGDLMQNAMSWVACSPECAILTRDINRNRAGNWNVKMEHKKKRCFRFCGASYSKSADWVTATLGAPGLGRRR